ncbi:MAG: hypothetical protein WA624_21620, partial [Methylocella sp.]
MRPKGSALPMQTGFNAALAAIDAIRPADEIEAMLAVQMVATYETAMDMLICAKQADLMPTLQECGSLAVKLKNNETCAGGKCEHFSLAATRACVQLGGDGTRTDQNQTWNAVVRLTRVCGRDSQISNCVI